MVCEIVMRTSPALVAIDSSPKDGPPRVDEAFRTLIDLIDRPSSDGLGPFQSGCSSEEVLVDLELDGARYLLLRMPLPTGRRIQLSPREQEIVRMVAKGHPNKVIADVLNISSWTVCTHLRRIFAKLGVGSRAAMVARLLEMGALNTEHGVTGAMR
jgi:DNA-binding CsgD family transcriptional regulator